MSRIGAISYSLTILATALIFARESIEPSIYLLREHEARNVPLGIIGLIISTFVPLAFSVCIWANIGKVKARWIMHLMFLPVAIVTFKVGAALFFWGADVSGDNSPEGYSLFVAGAFLSITLLVHAIALFVAVYKSIASRARGC